MTHTNPNHPHHPHYRTRVTVALTAVVFLIVVGMIGYHNLEGWNWIQSFYFTVATLTTVGYGDLHPTTDASRLFTGGFILIGVAVSLTALGVLGAAYLEHRTQVIVENRD